LINQLQAKNISVGANFKFGFRRSGDINTIKNTIKNTDIKLLSTVSIVFVSVFVAIIAM